VCRVRYIENIIENVFFVVLGVYGSGVLVGSMRDRPMESLVG
jgi:hypothetical protein